MQIKDKTLLITGGTGSFGTAVLNRFLNTDHFKEIRIFSRDEKKQDDMRNHYKNEKIKVTKDGKPLKSIDVYGSIEGFLGEHHEDHNHDEVESMAFYAKTNSNGEFVFNALKSGFWYLKADYKRDSSNKDCEIISDKTTLSFEVKQ